MAVIKSGVTADQLTVDATSKAARVTEYNSLGVEKWQSPSASFGKFASNTGAITVTASADTAPAGKVYFWNPVGGSKIVRIKKISFRQSPTSEIALPTAPRIGITRITLTGTGSGTQLAMPKKDTTCPVASAYLSTASTGATLSNVGLLMAFLIGAKSYIATYGGSSVVNNEVWVPSEEDAIVLRAGEGITIYQADAGTTSDTRTWNINIEWDESAS